MKRPRRVPLLLRTYGEERRQFYGQPGSTSDHSFAPASGEELSSWPTNRLSGELLYQGRRGRPNESDHNDNQAPICHTYSRQHHHHPNCRLSSDNLRTTSFVHLDGNGDGEEIDSPRTRYAAGRRRRGAADDDIDPLDTISSLTTPNSETRQIQRRRRLEERFGEDGYRAIEALEYITEHLKQLDDYKKVGGRLFYIITLLPSSLPPPSSSPTRTGLLADGSCELSD